MSTHRDSFTILGLWVLGLAVSHINESQLQTYESRTLFLMTSLQYYCILGLAEIKLSISETKLCAKDAGCAGNNTNSRNLYPPTRGYLRETCKSQNINPIYLTLSSPSVLFRS